MQLKTKAGLALVACGVAIFGAWHVWIKTRRFVPVDIPIAWSPEQNITAEFTLNFDGLYLIKITAEQSLPTETLHCLMDEQRDSSKCGDLGGAISGSWIISSGGREIAGGNTQEAHTAPVRANGVARVIGEFQGKSGRRYHLHLLFTADGQQLAPAHPHLQVAVASIAYTDLQSAAVLVFSAAFICVLFGVVLLVISFYVNQRVPDT